MSEEAFVMLDYLMTSKQSEEEEEEEEEPTGGEKTHLS